MIRAYDEEYVALAQRILGDAFDFAVLTVGVEADYFADLFITSLSARQFEKGNPAYVAGITGCELVRRVYEQHHMDIGDVEDVMYADKSPEYWGGYSLAFYQWYIGETFERILRAISMKEIIKMYPTFHEMDILQFVDAMNDRMRSVYPLTCLQERRKISGMSQRELAKVSGVSVRQIQMLEQRQRDINKTQAETIMKLSKALHCRMEDLLEKL